MTPPVKARDALEKRAHGLVATKYLLRFALTLKPTPYTTY
jgi:hypothetical protein